MRSTIIRRSLTTAVLVLAGACASSGAAGGSASTNRSVITEAELPTSGPESAYDAISRLRPEYLRPKVAQSFNLRDSAGVTVAAPEPALLINGQRAGELSDLRQVAATSIRSVRYYTIEQAKRKFGMQYGGGAIEVVYK
jgi:hypothetical protein